MSVSDAGLVYFVLDADRLHLRVKIGFTTSLMARLKALAPQTKWGQQPILLALESGGMEREQELHRKFDRLRLYGEWFDYEDDELRGYIAALPNPLSYVQDDHTLWRYARGMVGIPTVPPSNTPELEQRIDDVEADDGPRNYEPVDF